MTDNDDIADEELAERVRRGDDDAYGALWERHSSAGLAAARPFSNIADPEDLVSDAYLAILRALKKGGGPREAFRPYLYRTIRNVAYTRARPEQPVPLDSVGDLSDDSDVENTLVEKTLTVRAFRTLPDRWQTVLWYTEVEGMQPAEAAPLLGLSANSTAALAHRARQGLRKAWLQAHVSDARVPEGCRWTVDRMGDYARGDLTPRARVRFERHLATCARCTILSEELEDLGRQIAIVLLPLVLGAGAARALLDTRVDAHPVQATASGSVARTPLLVGAAAAGVVALVVAGIAIAGALAPTPETPDAVPAPPAESPSPTAPAPSPTAEPEKPDDPEAPVVTPPREPSPPSTPPPPPDTTAPDAVTLTGPVAGSVGNDPAPAFTGTGEPAARIEVSYVEGPAVPSTFGVTVPGSGLWGVASTWLPDGTHTARVVQIDPAGNRSAPVTVTFTTDTVALAPVVVAPAGPQVALPVITGTAEPGAAIDLRLGGTTVASTTADPAGAWSIDLPDPRAAQAELTAVQTDIAGNVSPASAAVTLLFERPDVLTPADGSTLPSTGGATQVSVEFTGPAGRAVEIVVDGVTTGNIHQLTGGPLVRVSPALADGVHVIGFRYVESGRPGALVEVAFTIAP